MLAPLGLIYAPPQAMDIDSNTASALAMDNKSSVRSCTTCSKAKAKCVRRPGAEVCERCARLRKECYSREPVVRRRKVTKTTRAAQLEKLENKIEHLVNALSTTQSQRGFSTDFGHPSPSTSISQTSERSGSIRNDDSQISRQSEVLSTLCEHVDQMEESNSNAPLSRTSTTPSAPAALTIGTQPTPPSLPYEEYNSLGVLMPEAEILLDRYRRMMSHSMPFVVLPDDVSAQQLSVDKPTLLHAIIVVAYFHDLPQQQIFVKKLMRNISERVIMNNEKSIDILQAILVFIGWYHAHIFYAQQATNLLHLAMAMIIDLGFDRPPQQCGEFRPPKGAQQPGQPPGATRVASLEEHRILAGTFYLSSMLETCFKKIDALPWSKYLEEALDLLETTAEHDSDFFLAQMVRVQHLIEQTTNIGPLSAPVQMYVKTFKIDLEALRKRDPCIDDPDNVLLQLQYLAAEVFIREAPLIELLENKEAPLRDHLHGLYRLVEHIKAFVDAWFMVPVSSYLTLPFAVFGQFAHVFIDLIKIASLEIDGWDMRTLDDQLNFMKVIDEASDRYEAATHSAPDGVKVNNDGFGKWASKMRFMRQVYETKFLGGGEKGEERHEVVKAVPMAGVEHSETLTSTPAQQQPTPPDDVLSGDFFNYLDENFWQSFAGDFDLGFPEMNMT